MRVPDLECKTYGVVDATILLEIIIPSQHNLLLHRKRNGSKKSSSLPRCDVVFSDRSVDSSRVDRCIGQAVAVESGLWLESGGLNTTHDSFMRLDSQPHLLMNGHLLKVLSEDKQVR